MPTAMRLEPLDPTPSESDTADKASQRAERLAQVLNAHFASVWRIGRRMGLSGAQAEEIAQEAFIVASNKLELIEAGAERAFLYGIALRLGSNLRRSAASRHESYVYEPAIHDSALNQPTPDELLDRKQRRVLLDGVLDAMTPQFREVLVLFEIEECSLQEISLALKIPEGTVASRLRRAREDFSRRVQRLFAKAGEFEEGA